MLMYANGWNKRKIKSTLDKKLTMYNIYIFYKELHVSRNLH